MRCYYDVLEVGRTATEDEIKKSYRKLALLWHPDKNPDKIEECTKYFPVLQQAYDVLMDPQERAWYDRHRDAILKGGLDEHYKDNSLNLFPYFSSTCYSGYGDDEKGFYAIYRHVFDTIVAEDGDFEEDKAKISKIPRFGDSKSDYETVVGPFYGHWASYCTSKPFSWLDEHDLLQAPNRRVFRAMEKENKKIRDAGKKERNEEVRMLVNFVRKRDKRVQAYRKLLDEQRQEQLAKVEAQRISQKLRNLKMASEYTDADWHNVSAREDALQEIESHFEDMDKKPNADEPDGQQTADDHRLVDNDDHHNLENDHDEQSASDFSDHLYCVACEKNFKTKKSYENHAQSKKHKENVDLLRKQMTEEDFKLLGLDRTAKKSDQRSTDGDRENNGKIQEKTKNRPKDRKIRRQSADFSDSSEEQAAIFCQKVESPEKPPLSPVFNEKSRLLKKSAQTGVTLRKTSENDENPPKNTPVESTCLTCRLNFPSKTKLFAHLKESGHAAIKNMPNTSGPKKEKKKR